MNEELNPTMETEDAQAQTSGGTEGVVSPSQNDGSDSLDTGEGAGAQAPDDGSAGRQKAAQDRAFNDAVASVRRRAEQEAAETMERERDRQIADLRIPNPFKPGTFFSGMKDMQDYGDALRRADAEKRAKAQNRAVEEVMAEDEERAFVRRQMAEKSTAQAEAQAAQKQREFIAKDLADFQTRFPDVDVARLDGDKTFRRFAGSRYGREPLGDLYEDFLALSGEAQAAGAARSRSKDERSTGAGSGGSTAVLTTAQRAELRTWNENHPEMRMTEKEFLDR